MEMRFYRDVRHPDFQFEIRLGLEKWGLDLRCMEAVTGLIEHYGWSIDEACAAMRRAVKPELLTRAS